MELRIITLVCVWVTVISGFPTEELLFSQFSPPVLYQSQTALCNGSLSDVERYLTLSYHNEARSRISKGEFKEGHGQYMPPAGNMLKMEWDCDLEWAAQTWAEQCKFEHSNGRGYGENLYMAVSSHLLDKQGLILNASSVWLEEIEKFGWNNLNLTMDVFYSGIGHATQMVWANTARIGCASTNCKNGTEVIVVCHYKSSGNVINTNVYNFGTPCSECPTGTECEENTYLCVQKQTTNTFSTLPY